VLEIYLFSNAEFDDKQTSKDAIRKVKEIATENHLFDLEIKRGKFGKPFFSKTTEMFFNISHTDGFTAIAFSNKEIGIDVEKVGYFNEKIIEKFYSEEEKKEIQASGNDKYLQKVKAVEIWTRKEAFVKNKGCSILEEIRLKNEGKI